MSDNVVIYLLVRNDLPSLNAGKAMAQALHAGNQIMLWGNDARISEYLGARGFGTCIALGASLKEIEDVNGRIVELGHDTPRGTVVDPSYPFWVDYEILSLLSMYKSIRFEDYNVTTKKALCTRPELTCAWFLVDRTDQRIIEIFSKFDLMP